MNFKTTLFILCLSFFQYSWGQEISDPNMILKSGSKYEVAKVYCINRDTLFLKLENLKQPYKIALKDIAYFDRNEFAHIRQRNFKDPNFLFDFGKHNFYKRVEIKSLGALFLGGNVSLFTTAFIIRAINYSQFALNLEVVIYSGLVGLVPGTVVAVLCIRRAIHKKAFRGAKPLE
jgi:hypothetical protein